MLEVLLPIVANVRLCSFLIL